MRWPQFSLARIFLAMVWFAIAFAAWRIYPPSWMVQGQNQLWVPLIFFSFRVFPIPTGIGALFGRSWRGFIAGTVLYLGLRILPFLLLGLGLGGNGPFP